MGSRLEIGVLALGFEAFCEAEEEPDDGEGDEEDN